MNLRSLLSTNQDSSFLLFQHRYYLFSSFLSILVISGDTAETFVFNELLLSNDVVRELYCLELRRG